MLYDDEREGADPAEAGAARERAAIVDWLRGLSRRKDLPPERVYWYRGLAADLEGGAHLGASDLPPAVPPMPANVQNPFGPEELARILDIYNQNHRKGPPPVIKRSLP